MGVQQMNGNSRRPPPHLNRMPSLEKPHCAQHDELIKYIYDSWNKVSQEVDRNTGNTAIYYQEQENQNLKDFKPFNLEEYWDRRMYAQHNQHS